MYNEDDAVAKLDGYVVSVEGAGKLIGKKTLVRIETVARSAASASLVEGAEVTDAAPPSSASSKPEEDDPTKPRRRGRRGGRGRRKKPEAAEETPAE